MSILHTVKQFFSGPPVLPVRGESTELPDARLELPTYPSMSGRSRWGGFTARNKNAT